MTFSKKFLLIPAIFVAMFAAVGAVVSAVRSARADRMAALQEA